MAPKTRLDAVVRIREHQEQEARLALASAAASTRQARERVRALREASLREAGPRSALEWEIAQAASFRMLDAIRLAESVVLDAEARERAAKAGFEAAHRAAESVRRAAESRREAIVREQEKAERKELDAFGQLAHVRRSS
ncbi:hypothetical protein [Vulgatibacter incomptus]|uniref:Flagellar FliJ protein n=1 Tax=Vulgatibacter incomptus TaxID=1391653 RepID=A0A0K1PHK8_9BACT|nr:hypothetical protein [Vulgatibacter incomptus]AKU93005.1 hypothetical protein AKJ08_3392 [Vulgatibacter incomptus]